MIQFPPIFTQLEKNLTQSVIDGESKSESLIRLLSWFGNALKNKQVVGGKLGHNLNLPALVEALKNQMSVSAKAPIIEDLTYLAKNFQGMQNVNQQGSGVDQPDIFLYPCFFAGEAGWGEWFFSFHNKDSQQEGAQRESYSLAFYLEMSNLGDLCLQMTMQSDCINGLIQLETPEIKEHVQSKLPELVNSLQSIGLSQITFSCKVAKNNVKQVWLNALADSAHLKDISVLDVTV